jgi:hypothetical protein
MLGETTAQPSGGLQAAEDPKKKRFSFTSITSSTPSAPPPEYTERDVTADLANLNLSATGSPTTDQCIAHLKLLEAFHALRQAVSKTDGLFGIHDELASRSAGRYEEELLKVYEKRWAIYVARAADRFQSWWEQCVPSSFKNQAKPRLAQRDLAGNGGVEFPNYSKGGVPIEFTADNLPPLGTFYATSTPPTPKSLERMLNRSQTLRYTDGVACLHA